MTTIEVTIRFADPRSDNQHTARDILTEGEAATLKGLLGGFYFRTQRGPAHIFACLYEAGVTMDDLENIEFKPV